MYISKVRRAVITEKNIQGAPDLVVEILSRGTRKRDETVKRALYERGDVQEYWLVDPARDAVKVFRRTAGAFVCAVELQAEDDTLTTPLLPDFSVTLAEIFAPAL